MKERTDHITRQELENLMMFEGISPEGVMRLLADCPIICLDKGEGLISQNQSNSSCYCILAGKLRIHLGSVDSEAISVLHAGESVGEMSLLDNKKASAHVVCHEKCELLVLNEDVFWSLVNASHVFSRNLLFLLTSRLRDNNVSVSKNLKKQQEYRLHASIDELTGLYNRRWLKNILSRQMKRGQYSDAALSLLMIDVDHFKEINDTRGHLVGDQVLKLIAQVMIDNVRPTDFVARYGGEEFVTVLPASDLAAALVVASRVNRAIRESSKVIAEWGRLPDVTVSIGIAQMRDQESMDEFIGRADRALYRAKKKGRNRVEE